MAGKRLSRDFTKGNVPKQLLWFMIPFMLSNALQVLYSTVDMVVVGKYVGTPGLSAVSQSSQIMNFATMRGTGAFIQGIGNAKLSMILALMDGVVLRIGLSWLFGIAFGWGFYGFVLGYGIAAYGFAIPSFIYFVSGIWKKRRILAEDI